MKKEIIFGEFEKMNLKAGRFLLAFSGGPDSVFLLHLLSSYLKEDLRNHIEVCYINYHDSPYVDQEEEVVRNAITPLNLVLHHEDAYFEKEKDRNFEDWARLYRYSLFLKLVKERGLDGLLTAHQLSDSIETYLLQKERGNLPLIYGLPDETSWKGMKVYRPLLSVSKEELISYLLENSIPYYDDVTNYDGHTKRNLIRKNRLTEEEQDILLQEMEEKNRRLQTLYRSFSKLKEPLSFLYYDSLTEEERHRLIFYLLSEKRLSVEQKRLEGLAKEIYEFLKGRGTKKLSLDDDFCLYRTPHSFFIDKKEQKPYSYRFEEPKEYETEEFSLDLSTPSLFRIPSFPITVRNYRKGDRISSNLNEKDVLTFLKKQQVPSKLIDSYPVFLAEGRIFFVPFFSDIKKERIPFRFKVRY